MRRTCKHGYSVGAPCLECNPKPTKAGPMKNPQNPKCSRCNGQSGLLLDGPLTIRLCPSCRETWFRSAQRAAILRLVGDFLGRDHPAPG